MNHEHPTAPLRVIDTEQLKKDFMAIEARQAGLTRTGQQLLARILPSSKHHGQGSEYVVLGGPGGQYRLKNVDLFAVFDASKPPIQISVAPKMPPSSSTPGRATTQRLKIA